MKKFLSKVLALPLLAGLVMTTIGCSQYSDTGLGQSGVLQRGAAFRSSGGGIDSLVHAPGAHRDGGFTVEVTPRNIMYTPRMIMLREMPVIMKNMNNQQLKFNLGLQCMLNPRKTWYVHKNFRNYEQELKTLFRLSSNRILERLDIGLDLDSNGAENDGTVKAKKPVELSFDSREAVSKRILDDFKKSVAQRYPEFVDCFVFPGVTLNNVEFNAEVLKHFEAAVAKHYEMEISKYRTQKADIKGKIDVAASEADLEAYSIEAGALTDEVLAYMANDLQDELVENRNIKVDVWWILDDDGTLSQFSGR